ncbi:MAG TPA: hypothetical protein VLL08_06940 [Kineosporiaceae bacterium]|nr:hypothetical protein [Kineosporiaceae bacterium]
MAPTGTQVQAAIGVGWLVLGLYWLYRSTIVASSTISLLFGLICALAAAANAFVIYRRTAVTRTVPQTVQSLRPGSVAPKSGGPESPPTAPFPQVVLHGADEPALDFTQIQPVTPASKLSRARWPASGARPAPTAPETPSPSVQPSPEDIQGTADPEPEWAPAPMWASAPQIAPALQRSRAQPPVPPDPQAQPDQWFQEWSEPQFQPEPEPSPETDPDLRWRRPRPGRS